MLLGANSNSGSGILRLEPCENTISRSDAGAFPESMRPHMRDFQAFLPEMGWSMRARNSQSVGFPDSQCFVTCLDFAGTLSPHLTFLPIQHHLHENVCGTILQKL